MNPNQSWVNKLKVIRDEKIMSIEDQCQEIGIVFFTFKKFIDPNRTQNMSLRTLRKIKFYLEKENNGRQD